MVLVQKELQSAYIWEYVPPYLCFTANTAGSTIALNKVWSPTAVTLETSTDWSNWSTYTMWSTITLSNIGDKVYWRNTSETDNWYGSSYDYYRFAMTWSIAWSWDVTSLINKNCTTTLSSYCFRSLFSNCTSLTTPPELPATTLSTNCYYDMFDWCTSLTTAPSLPATTLANYCYGHMFYGCKNLTMLPNLPATTLPHYCYESMFFWCTNIELSTTQNVYYNNSYRIPKSWTWTTGSASFQSMFLGTWWTFTWTPSANTTYYTSNTVV